jgi:hypothetical protein
VDRRLDPRVEHRVDPRLDPRVDPEPVWSFRRTVKSLVFKGIQRLYLGFSTRYPVGVQLKCDGTR